MKEMYFFNKLKKDHTQLYLGNYKIILVAKDRG